MGTNVNVVVRSRFKNSNLPPALTNAIGKKLQRATGKVAMGLAINSIQVKKMKATERSAYVCAIMFQRIVSRTPYDEEYLVGYQKAFGPFSGGPIYHKPDSDYTRNYWHMSIEGTSKSLNVKFSDFGEECFETVNDTNGIEKIYRRIMSVFEGDRIKNVTFYNDNWKAELLEYGHYEADDSRPKKGPNRRHGITGGFSVQAPAGMFRITMVEFDMILNEVAVAKYFGEKKKFSMNEIYNSTITNQAFEDYMSQVTGEDGSVAIHMDLDAIKF